VSLPEPLILDFDPKIPSVSRDLTPGPIVIHGGFPLAFFEFDSELKGNWRLVISIACW
jgi:hypothetical protein